MKKKIYLSIFLLFALVFPVGNQIKVGGLGSLVIHEGGRAKPFDSYARQVLLILNGQASFEDQTAIEWLAKAMFTPEATLDDRVFKTTFNEVLFALGLAPDESRRYSFNELSRAGQTLFSLASNALRKQENERSAFEKEVIRLFQNFSLYRQVLNSFIFAKPIDKFSIDNQEVIALLGLSSERKRFSYFEILQVKGRLMALVNDINQKPFDLLKAEEIFILNLAENFSIFPQSFLENPIKFFPTVIDTETKWFSVWEILSVHGEVEQQNAVFFRIENLNNLALAYTKNDQALFDDNLQSFTSFVTEGMKEEPLLSQVPFKAKVEVFYNKLDPFYRASIFYGLSLLLILIYFLTNKNYLKSFSGVSLIVAFFFNTLGIILRMLITYRPPITNLFETFVFVAFIVVLIGLILERYNKKGIGLVSAALCGLTLLLISNRFISNGDTLEVLVAVLRSNFWLSTHVITINLGYGGVVLSGVIAHFYFFKLLKKNPEKTELKNITKMIYATQAFGIIFTFLGTMLGGIWADQSWGRFWGWDPKENGALLIVLWSALIFHARFGGIVKDLGFAAGSIIGIPVVMLAWFGINLLGIGLHSYGFISGVAYSLVAYMVAQFLFLMIMLYIVEYKKYKKT